MTILLPILVPTVGAFLVLTPADRRAALVLGTVALAATVAVALWQTPGQTLTIGDGVLATTPYGRLAFASLAVSALLLALASAASDQRPGGIVALLVALPGAWVALTAADPAVGGWAILAAGVGALVGSRVGDRSRGQLGTVTSAVRAVVVAGTIGVAGIPVGASAAGSAVPDPTVGGLAFIVVAGALALRTAAVPLHGWAARLGDAVSLPTLTAVVAWLPAVAIAVTIAWTDSAMAPIAVDLGPERGLLIAVALATLGLASLAAAMADDLGHVVAYLTIAGTGTALLGIAAIDPAAWTPTRGWVAVIAVAAAALAAGVGALAGAYGSRWLPDLDGWARRSPVLATALAATGVALVGVPGWFGFEARATLVDLTVEGPLGIATKLLLLAPLVAVARILVVGVRPIDATVRDGRSERLTRPERWAVREATTGRERLRALAEDVGTTWRLDSIPLASALALAVGVLALALSAGAFDLGSAAAGQAPGVVTPVEPVLEPDASPTVGPPASETPLPEETLSPGETPLPGDEASPSP